MKSTISDLQERITILVPAKISDKLGGYTLSWANKQTVWAHIIASKESALQPERKEWSKPYYRVRIRPGIDLKPTMRVKWQEKILKIISEPILDPKKKRIEFSAYEIKKGKADHE